jgi:hypothetical protein
VTIELTPIQQQQLQQGKPVIVKVVPVTKSWMTKKYFGKHKGGKGGVTIKANKKVEFC